MNSSELITESVTNFISRELGQDYIKGFFSREGSYDLALEEKIASLGLKDYFLDLAATFSELAQIARLFSAALYPGAEVELCFTKFVLSRGNLHGKEELLKKSLLPVLDPNYDKKSDNKKKRKLKVFNISAAQDLLIISEKSLIYAKKAQFQDIDKDQFSALDLLREQNVLEELYSPDSEELINCEEAYHLFLILKSVQLIAIARRVIELTVAYTKERKQFSVAVASFQAVQHQLADIYAKFEASAALSEFAVKVADLKEGSPAKKQLAFVALATFESAREIAPRACEVAIQLHGGIGFTWEHALHLYLRRSLSLVSEITGPNLSKFEKNSAQKLTKNIAISDS
jgi:hypothetical protein